MDKGQPVNLYDQRVRGHDFLAYFKAHMMTICLVFWFFTISVSVAASTIYLVKKMEMDSKNALAQLVPEKKESSGERIGIVGGSGDYHEYDVIDFLIDAFYANSENDSRTRESEASMNDTSQNFTVPVYGTDNSE